MLMRLTRTRLPSVRASPAAGKAAETLGFSPALKTSVACRMAPMQTPPEHTSLAVAAFPSSHGAALKGFSQPTGSGELMSAVQTFPSKHGGRLVDGVLLEVLELLELVEELLVEVELLELLELVEELLVEVELVVELLVEVVDEVEVDVEVVVVVTQPGTGVWRQPAAESQVSVVQGFASSQLIGVWVQPLAGSQPSVGQRWAWWQLTALPRHWPARQPSAVVQALPSSQSVPLATGVYVQTPA